MASRLKALFVILAPALFVIVALFLPAIVMAGYQNNSILGGRDYCLTVQDEAGSVVNNQCKPLYVSEGALSDEGDYFLIRAGLASGNATTMTTAQTAISTSYTMVDKEIASDPAFQTGTLVDGTPGQVLTIRITVVQADGTFTLTPATATGFTSLVFEAVDDMVTLLYVDDTVGWILISQESVQTE